MRFVSHKYIVVILPVVLQVVSQVNPRLGKPGTTRVLPMRVCPCVRIAVKTIMAVMSVYFTPNSPKFYLFIIVLHRILAVLFDKRYEE